MDGLIVWLRHKLPINKLPERYSQPIKFYVGFERLS